MTPSATGVEQLLDRATPEQLADHLTRCDTSFVPPLSGRVDIESYASKLSAHALRFEAWARGTLVGLVAAYPDQDAGELFITNVSVLPGWRGQGLAETLLRWCADSGRELGMRRVWLDVAPGNAVARRLYGRLGFAVAVEESPGRDVRMMLTL